MAQSATLDTPPGTGTFPATVPVISEAFVRNGRFVDPPPGTFLCREGIFGSVCSETSLRYREKKTMGYDI